MSTRVEHRIWQFADARGTELLVLLALGVYASDDGQVHPNIDALAGRVRLTVAATRDILMRLERRGELSQPRIGTFIIAAATRTRAISIAESSYGGFPT